MRARVPVRNTELFLLFQIIAWWSIDVLLSACPQEINTDNCMWMLYVCECNQTGVNRRRSYLNRFCAFMYLCKCWKSDRSIICIVIHSLIFSIRRSWLAKFVEKIFPYRKWKKQPSLPASAAANYVVLVRYAQQLAYCTFLQWFFSWSFSTEFISLAKQRINTYKYER